MHLFRTILAFVIAASLVAAPIGAAAASVVPSDDMHAGMIMDHGASPSMDECCPDDMKGAPSHTDGYKCGMGLCCVGGTVASADMQAVSVALFAATGSRIAIPADQVLSFRGSTPPFRPPRV